MAPERVLVALWRAVPSNSDGPLDADADGKARRKRAVFFRCRTASTGFVSLALSALVKKPNSTEETAQQPHGHSSPYNASDFGTFRLSGAVMQAVWYFNVDNTLSCS